MKYTLPLSVKIVQWAVGVNEENAAVEKRIEELYSAGYSIVASGCTPLRDSPPPKPHNPAAIAWVIMSTRGDLQP